MDMHPIRVSSYFLWLPSYEQELLEGRNQVDMELIDQLRLDHSSAHLACTL